MKDQLFLVLACALTAAATNLSTTAKVHWLEDTPAGTAGTTFGLPWPRGQYFFNETQFTIAETPLQSWVTGYWRDGSIKWTGHAIPALDSVASEYEVTAAPVTAARKRRSAASSGSLTVEDGTDEVTIDTGNITVTFPKTGSSVVGSILTASGKEVGRDGKLVLQTQTGIAEDAAARANTTVLYTNYVSSIENVTVVSGAEAVRALVTVTGTHEDTASTTARLPFELRFYLYAGATSLRVLHSVVFDQPADNGTATEFITGLGIRLTVPLEGEELYNRHVRLGGVDDGLLHEAVQGITGLRRDPGTDVRAAQYAGEITPNISTWDTRVSLNLQYIPAWNDYQLNQLSPDGFTTRKRTKAGQAWVGIPGSTRSSGLAYLGGATVGGLAVVLRDFWKRHPSGLEITNAATDAGQITLWLYNPEASPLDLRAFHDGLGEETYAEQLAALAVTYEDYEPGFATPYGIARTSEVFLHVFAQTPTADDLNTRTSLAHTPPVLVPEPDHIHESRALGTYWAPTNWTAAASGTSKADTLESHLDFLVGFYGGQVEDRRWYGFLDYGDFMHTYDSDRHTWRYDVGGYAWDNSELSPDLFLWQQFLRTGRADVYRLAEALGRHTGEVDVYHIGDWKGLGTRHGVQHFGDSAKQVRIAQPQFRRAFFYLSGGDERVGALLDEALDADKTYGLLDPQRKVRTDGWTPEPGEPVAFSLGTDWAGLAAGWLLGWERRGSRWQEAQEKLVGTATGIAALTNGFVTGSGLYTIANGSLGPPPADPTNAGIVVVSHLNAVFGLPELVDELLEHWGDDEDDAETIETFRSAWLDYCFYYGATAEQQEARYGANFTDSSLGQGHSRLSAYYSYVNDNNITVALRAWDEFYNSTDGTDGLYSDDSWATVRIDGNAVLTPIDEATWITTNAASQYGLATIQNLALAGEALDESPLS